MIYLIFFWEWLLYKSWNCDGKFFGVWVVIFVFYVIWNLLLSNDIFILRSNFFLFFKWISKIGGDESMKVKGNYLI